jgi:predicted phage terminase large subunit-like protein
VDPDLPDDLLEPIWPQGKTKQFLLNMRSTKTVLFSQQMLCRRVLEGSAVFDERTVRRYDLEWEDWGNGQLRYVLPDSRAVAVTEAREQRNYTKWMSMDLNNKQTEKSDYCVMTVGAKDDLGHLWLIDMKRGRPNVLHQIAWAIDMFIEHQPEMVMIETVAYQASFRTLLEKEAWSRNLSLPILEESRGTMLSKSTRIRLMQAPVGAGLLHVPDHPKFDPLMEEIRAYTGHKNDRDDCLDTVADLLTRIPPPAPAPRTKNRLTSFPVAGSISQSDMVESILARGIGHGVAFSANPRRGPVERARSR